MADRSRLHINKLEDFKHWLEKDGWVVEEPKGTWEVLRARKTGRKNPLIVYTKMDAKEHLSVMDRDSGVIGAFLRDSKKPKTNAGKIRAMSDEELAEFLLGIDHYWDDGQCIVGFGNAILNDSKSDILDWLQSEEEGE